MKEIIYLDTDMLNSMIAQLDEGLILNYGRENDNTNVQSTNQTSTTEESTNHTAEGGLSSILKGTYGRGWGTRSSESSSTQEDVLEGQRDIINKSFHDYALQVLLTKLHKEKLIHTKQNAKEGDIVEGSDDFRFFDFDLISRSADSEKLLHFYDKTPKPTMDIKEARKILRKKEAGNQLNKDEERKLDVAKETVDNDEGRAHFKAMIESLESVAIMGNNVFPEHAFMRFQNIVALLKKEYMRESSEIVSMRTPQNRKLKFIGRVITNKNELSDTTNPEEFKDMDLDQLPRFIVDNFIVNFEVIKPEDTLITPIAIYHEYD